MTVVTASRLIDGYGNDPLDDCAMVIEGGRVEAIGPVDSIQNSNENILDYGDKIIVPGLIDAHLHLNGTRTFDPFKRLTKSIPLATTRAVVDLKKTLDAGVTTVRDLHSAPGIALRDGVEAGEIEGPRIFACGGNFSQTGGPADNNDLPVNWVNRREGILARIHESRSIDGVNECRSHVRRRLREGADVIKIFATGAGFHGLGQPENPSFNQREIKAIAEEAHRVGVPLAAHCIGVEGTKNALECGADTIEHGWYLEKETINLLLSSGAILVPTLNAIHQFAHKGSKDNTPPRFFEDLGGVELAKEAEKTAVKSVTQAYMAGVPIAMGTDSLGLDLLPHGENAREARLLHELIGLSEIEVIQAATGVAGQTLPAVDIGGLKPGNHADFLVLGEDPLEDLSALTNSLEAVYKDGRRLR